MYIEYEKAHKPNGFEAITLYTGTEGTVKGLTIPTGSRRARVKVITQSMRFRDDGTNPTSIIGFSVAANGELDLISYEQMEKFKAVSLDTAAGLEVLYYKV